MKNMRTSVILIIFFFLTKIGYSQTPKIDTLFDVNLNGLEQKVLVQSNDLKNPLILWLHGGPGTSEMFINHHCMNKLYDNFTVVHWDQRGTALSYNDSIKVSDISSDKIFDDAFQLTQILKANYQQDKIFIIGHSFGSILGIHLAEKYPDEYYSFIGVGQVINDNKSREMNYKWFVKKLTEEKDTVELNKIVETKKVSRRLINKYNGIYYKGISLFDIIKTSPYYYEGYLDDYLSSMKFVRESMGQNPSTYFKEIMDINKLNIPVYFFEGRHDKVWACSPELVVDYCDSLDAPVKEIVWFENSAHHPNIDEPDKFQKVLINKVLKETYKD